jgi:RNA polymerase sigma factor (sigma-70 family)
VGEANLIPILQHVHRLAGRGAEERTDGQLLELFALQGDGEAFASLVRRHGSLVWRTCSRLLYHTQDAEDAWQATFLLLARKASSIRNPGALASFLHTTAGHVALKARRARQRRQAHEQQAARKPVADPSQEAAWRELGRLVEEEVQGLADKYRLPLLLCYWEGHTHEEAARRLGWPVGTVKTRLASARQILQSRLQRRGVTLPAGVLALLLAPETMPAALPSPLVAAVVRAARAGGAGWAGTVTAQAIALAESGLRGLTWPKLKAALLLMLVLGAAVAGVSGLGHSGPGGKEKESARAGGQPAAEVPADEVDAGGDAPLPAGAVARLGARRFQHPGRAGVMAYSPDGRFLAVQGYGFGVLLWDAATGREVRRQPVTLSRVDRRCIDFSPNGRLLAAVDYDADVVRIWETTTGKEVRTLPAPEPRAADLPARPAPLAQWKASGRGRLPERTEPPGAELSSPRCRGGRHGQGTPVLARTGRECNRPGLVA